MVQLGAAATSDPKTAASHIGIDNFTIDEAWIALADVGLSEAGTCPTGGDAIDFPGPVAANLLTGEIYPAPPRWSRDAADSYCEMQADVRAAGSAIKGAPAALADYGAFVRGTRSDGTPFELRLDVDARLHIGAPGKPDFTLNKGPVGLLLTFNLDAWISGAVLSQAEIKDGTITADKNNNAQVADAVKQQIPGSAGLLRDANRNGLLDDGDGQL